MVLFGLVFGIALGVGFGINEDAFKDFVAEGIATHPDVHDSKSQDKIWRYAQRAHFHSTGIAAFSIGLLLLVSISNKGSTSPQGGQNRVLGCVRFLAEITSSSMMTLYADR